MTNPELVAQWWAHPSQTLRVDEMEQRDSMVSYGAEKGAKAAWGRRAVLLRRA